MSKEITGITLVFENCEEYSVENKYIGTLVIEDVKKQVRRMGCNYIGEYYSCESCVIEIFVEGKREYHPFNQEGMTADIFKRARDYADITGIDIKYDDGSVESILVPYQDLIEGQLGSPNLFQRGYINQAGDLFIVIGENVLFEDYFPINEIEDEEYQKFHKEMIME